MAHIFISYATPDRAIANEVASWLRAAGHEPFLDDDLRDGISVGEDWEQRLYRELREVDAVIGVVTSSFVASNWCSAELGIAGALGCRLMPLRAEAGVVHPLMPRLHYADYLADPQQARDRVLQAVRLLEDGGATWREGDNPFPGLEPFTAALSRVFFGRAAEAREVGNRMRAPARKSGRNRPCRGRRWPGHCAHEGSSRETRRRSNCSTSESATSAPNDEVTLVPAPGAANKS